MLTAQQSHPPVHIHRFREKRYLFHHLVFKLHTMVLKSIRVDIQRSGVFALTGARDSFVRVVHSGSCRFLLLDIEVAFSYLLLPTVLLQ